MKGSKAAGIAIAGGLLAGALIGGGLVYVNRDAFFKAATPEPAAKSELARFATGSLTRLETLKATPMAPAYVFKTREGADATFADFRGKVVVVNLWAMWCAPCRTEMPTLAANALATDIITALKAEIVESGRFTIPDFGAFIAVNIRPAARALHNGRRVDRDVLGEIRDF